MESLYLYTYACHEDEAELCGLELRTLLGITPEAGWMTSPVPLDADRSPFIKRRLAVTHQAESWPELLERIQGFEVQGASFKVVYTECDTKHTYEERRAFEREAGAKIRGKAEMRTPERLYGIACAGGRWLFGELSENAAVWLQHASKPNNYSTALSTRVARAVVNIAVPEPAGRKVIDPCCGIGTVLIEALSMGIDIVGSDLNPLAVRGARSNLLHFGYPDIVRVADMTSLTGSYDTLILDMPYNLCSKLSDTEKRRMLDSARRLANRAVIVTVEPIEDVVEAAGFQLEHRCTVRKSGFSRQVLVCP